MTLSSPAFRAVATCVVPEASRLDAAQWDEMEAIVAGAIAARPRAVQRQLALFLILVEWFPLLRYGRRLSRLDPAGRTKFLDRRRRVPDARRHDDPGVRVGVWRLDGRVYGDLADGAPTRHPRLGRPGARACRPDPTLGEVRRAEQRARAR